MRWRIGYAVRAHAHGHAVHGALARFFQVPPAHRGAAQRTVHWLGFATASLRLAAMRPVRRGAGVGLCEVRFWEEASSHALQLAGAAAVRGGVLQLTPGAAFTREAARVHLTGGGLHVPPTVGGPALDAAVRHSHHL